MDCKEITNKIIELQNSSDTLFTSLADLKETEKAVSDFKELKSKLCEILRLVDLDRIGLRDRIAKKFGFDFVDISPMPGYLTAHKVDGRDEEGMRIFREYVLDEAEETIILGPYFNIDDSGRGTFLVSKKKDGGELLVNANGEVLFDPHSHSNDSVALKNSFHGEPEPIMLFYLYSNKQGDLCQRRYNSFLRADGRIIFRESLYTTYFNEGLAWTWRDGKYYLCDEDENIFFGVDFDRMDRVEDGLSLAYKKTDEGLAVHTVAIDGVITDIHVTVESSVHRYGRYCVGEKPDGTNFYFTIEGKILDKVKVSTISGYVNKEGIFKVEIEKDKYILVDEDGTKIADKIFDFADEFEEGYIAVKDDDGYHLMDTNGKYLEIEVTGIKSISGFREGIALVQDIAGYTLIDTMGKDLLGTRYQKINPFPNHGVYSVTQIDGSECYIYKDGRKVFSI